MDHNGNDGLAPASFDTTNELLIPTQLINTGMPSIPAISNNIFNPSTETTMSEHDNSNDHEHARNNIASYNVGFDLSIDDSSDFMGSAEKNDATTQPALVTKATCLAPEEVVCRASGLPHQKMKSRVDVSGLSAEEEDDSKDDGIGGGKHTQQVCNTTNIFCSVDALTRSLCFGACCNSERHKW